MVLLAANMNTNTSTIRRVPNLVEILETNTATKLLVLARDQFEIKLSTVPMQATEEVEKNPSKLLFVIRIEVKMSSGTFFRYSPQSSRGSSGSQRL